MVDLMLFNLGKHNQKEFDMKVLILRLIIVVNTALLVSCSLFPIKTEIQEGHFRFENFKRDKGLDREYVYLLCYRKKPSDWFEPRQYIAGEHVLWVKAHTNKRSVKNSAKEAYVNFDIKLLPDKSYMLNREIDKNSISIWIQETETGNVVSEVKTVDLERPFLMQELHDKKMCDSSTI